MAGPAWPWMCTFWTHRKLGVSRDGANIALKLISFVKEKNKKKRLMTSFGP